ncbi:hypothetical protein NESM_000132400 [Novymonas esmeraldas]|uniref:Uncharacterized protein n=1 Tax=Novymonas esmeraldas TaxID=1808958 RepID=A0AAW0F3C3_9TRYP
MQQVFPASTDRSGSGDAAGRPILLFPVPETLSMAPTATPPRKRSRSPTVRPHAALTPEESAALRRFIHCGNQPTPPARWFSRPAAPRSTPAQLLAGGAAASRSPVAPEHRWCCVALRHAMSLLCRVVALDSSSAYLRTASPPTPAAAAATASAPARAATNTAAASAAAPLSARTGVSTLELYCRFQALELELEDATLRAAAVAAAGQPNAVPEAHREQVRSDVDATVRCAEQCVNALEATLVRMLLGSATLSVAPTPPLDYVARLLRELPSVFQSEQWPAQFVCDVEALQASHGDTEEEGPALAAAPSSPLARALRSGGAAASCDSGGAERELREQLGGAATSLALRSLFDLCGADVWNLLGVAAASPVSRLAAIEKLAAAASASGSDATTASRRVLEVGALEFRDVLVRAWNRCYGQLGVRRLSFEMQALFYGYAMRAHGTARQPSGRSGATLSDVRQLWAVWRRSLRAHTAAFMMKVGVTEASIENAEGDWDTELDSCDVMRQHAVAADALADVQLAALRVIAKLQAVDTKGWFAVPAFDLVNIDFMSLRYWVASPTFAHKSKREAYRALCRVLERMVDSCVLKYGPTHAFSDVITTVRQQLVDVARAEGLL